VKSKATPPASPLEPARTLPPFLREQAGVVIVSIKAQPRAHRTELAGLLGNELKVKVAAPPVDSAANEALLEFFAERLQCPKRNVSLLRGATSTHKQIAIAGLTAGQIAAGLT
jgi:hypothetical protein